MIAILPVVFFGGSRAINCFRPIVEGGQTGKIRSNEE
jgi:hypothetical protein